MKKFSALLLALILALAACSATAENPSAVSALPAVGDVVEGFRVLEVRDFPMIGGTAVWFEHERTGAKLMYLANGDTNRVFDLTFLTRPIDDTGLPHVFEHATLGGSEKYPASNLFFNLSNQTYNTYMNAQTFSIMTTFPVASLSEAQLLKYADYYTDSCLHPIILTDESSFLEEAWRYRLADADSDLTLEGTVYSEMQGAASLESAAYRNNFRTAFPGSVVGLNEGGDPDAIPDMTWDALRDFHSLYYHPSNSIAYLYGRFEDYTAFLALLNDAYAPYEKQEFTFVDSGYTPLTGPVTAAYTFPVEAGSPTENASTVYYSIVCPGLCEDAEEELVLNTLTDLLIAESSPMNQALKKALPTCDFAAYIDTTAPDDAIVFFGRNINAEDAETFRKTVDEALAEIAENGFDAVMADSVMASVRLKQMLTMENSDVGVDLIRNVAYAYATSGRPFSHMDYVDALAEMDEWNSQGRYRQAAAKWLAGSELTALSVTSPAPGEKEEKDAALAARLAEVKAGMTAEELQALIDLTNAEKPEEDSSALVAQLQAVTVDSLPEEVRTYPVTDSLGDDGIRRISAEADIADAGQVALFLDARALPQDEIHYFALFNSLVGRMDTDAHTRDELDLLTDRYLYKKEFRLSLLDNEDEPDGYHPYLRMGWICMKDDLADAYDLMYELLHGTQFTDTQALLDNVQALKANLRTTIDTTSYQMQLERALAVDIPLCRYYSYFNYLEYYNFLCGVEKTLSENPDEIVAGLQDVQSRLCTSSGAISAFAGDAASIDVNRPLADAFLAKLNAEPGEYPDYDLPVPDTREAVIINSGMQFNGRFASYEALGMDEFSGDLDAIMKLVGDVYLLPQLRDQYGVYSPWAGALDEGVYLLTYRDPNVAETFAVYDSLPDQLAASDFDQAALDGYILSSYASYAKSSGELAGAMNAITNILTGKPQDQNLRYMKQLKAVTPEAVRESAAMFEKLNTAGVLSTTGSASKINANAELYNVILNPFDAQDTSMVEFSDVPEGSEYYDAVHAAFEGGLMAPLTEDAFGVDEAATNGDLLGAVYVMIGGAAPDAAAARETLAGYGVVPADLDLDAPLTEGFMADLFKALGAELATDTPDATMTRGEFAAFLAE